MTDPSESSAARDLTAQRESPDAARATKKYGLFAGAALFFGVLMFCDLEPGQPQVTRAAAMALLMAVWWLTEAAPLAVTAMLPLVLAPLLGLMDGKAVAGRYINDHSFLFIGGFLVALAMERWNLHKRIALRTLLFFGVRPTRMLLGFMAATAFLSMWISNTAATMMMATIVLAIIMKLEEGAGKGADSAGKEAVKRFTLALLLGVAYSASIGGMATLVGTPTNLAFASIFKEQFPAAPSISFATWFLMALPISLSLLAVTWLFLCWRFLRGNQDRLKIDQDLIRRQYDELGPMSFAERVVLADFVMLALLWLFRRKIEIGSFMIPGWSGLFAEAEFIKDGTVAIGMAVLLFLIPSKPGAAAKVMDWKTASRLPWDIVLLFGGGFALAATFQQSGLTLWLAGGLTGAGSLHPLLLLTLACLAITFLTELTSNLATNQMMLPVLASLAITININPLFLMVPVTLSCSCAFMMPVATPPNAIVFGARRMRVADMARTGLALNFFAVILVVLGMYFIGQTIWGIDLSVPPEWMSQTAK